jgi:hypothetical protein
VPSRSKKIACGKGKAIMGWIQTRTSTRLIKARSALHAEF